MFFLCPYPEDGLLIKSKHVATLDYINVWDSIVPVIGKWHWRPGGLILPLDGGSTNITLSQSHFSTTRNRLGLNPDLRLTTWTVAYIVVKACVEFWWRVMKIRGGADKSLARPGRKKAKATKLGIYSTYSPRSSIHFLASCSKFFKPLKRKSECCLSNQDSTAAMMSTSDEKWRPFNCFFSPGNRW